MWGDILSALSYGLLWVQVALPFVVAVVMGICVPLLCFLVASRPEAGMALVAAVFFADVFFSIPVLPVGVTVYLTDLMSILLAAAGLWRLTQGTWNRIEAAWMVYTLAFFISLLLGLLKFGSAAGVEARYHFNAWAVVTYFLRVRMDAALLIRFTRIWAWLVAALALVCTYRWSAMAFGFGDTASWNESGTSLRVLKVDYAGAFMVGVPLFLWARRERLAGAWAGLLALVAFACAFVLQHRTVWVAGLLMAFYLFSRSRRDAPVARKGGLAMYAVIAALVVGSLFTAGGRIGESLSNAVQEVGAHESTWSWRTQSWRALLQQWSREDLKTLALGYPYGKGFDRYIEDAKILVTQNPHNNYVYLILRVGLVGTVAFVGVLLGLLIHMHRQSRDAVAVLLAGLLVFQLAYFIPYPSSYGLAPFVGLACAYLRQPAAAKALRSGRLPQMAT